MTLGSVQPGAEVWTVGKDGTNAIPLGAVCVPDAATTPDSYKLAPAGATAGPYGVCVNKAAAATDTAFAMAFPGSFVTVRADGAIEPGKDVQVSGATAGEVITIGAGAACGRYIGHENEITGKTPATAAADGDLIVIRLGGAT